MSPVCSNRSESQWHVTQFATRWIATGDRPVGPQPKLTAAPLLTTDQAPLSRCYPVLSYMYSTVMDSVRGDPAAHGIPVVGGARR
jgi:hypothetical protein